MVVLVDISAGVGLVDTVLVEHEAAAGLEMVVVILVVTEVAVAVGNLGAAGSAPREAVILVANLAAGIREKPAVKAMGAYSTVLAC